MALPFRIPKKKQPSDACSLDMQSPLSRLQDSSSPKMQWDSVTHNGRASHKFSFTNGKTFSKHSQSSETIRSPEPLTCSTRALKGTVRGKISFTLNKQPIKISPSRVNRTPHKVSETGSSRAKCQTPTPGRDFTANNRWRPKRASDTLCRDENHMGDFESPSFKIRRDSGETETSEFFREEEDIEGTQGPSRVTETQRPSNVKDGHISKTDRRFKSTGCVSPVESTTKKGKNVSVSNEESTFKLSNLESRSERHVQEEQPGLRTSGEKAALPVPVRKDPLVSPSSSKSEDPFKSFYENRLSRRPRLFDKTYKRAKPSSTEPIVLSSDEDGSDDVNDTPGSSREQPDLGPVGDTQTGKQKSPKANTGSQKTASKVEVPSIMELPFSTLHYDTGEAESNGTVVITDDGISIPLKGADGDDDIALSVTCAQLLLYGLWDGGLARDGSLFPDTEEPAPSLLFLIVSDAQARLIQKELSVIHSVHSSSQACPFVLLVLADQLGDLQAAMLASLMDLIGLKHGQSPLSNALSWPDGLNRLHCHRQGVHLLSLLGQNVEDGHDTALKSAGGTSSCHGEPTVRRPLRSHSRTQSLPRRLIQYPPPPSKGGITVTTEDLECLKDGEFLNDVIIDFYLKYLLLETADEDVAERSHIFSSFFYKQLTRKDSSCPEETGRTAQHRRHHRVRTWTRHVDIFSKDYLFIPVNQEAHWYLVVICFPGLERPECVEWRGKAASSTGGQTVNVNSAGENQTGGLLQSKSNSLKPSGMGSNKLPDCTVSNCTREKVCRRPCILVMDSLKLSYHQRIYTLLREYLQVEWEVRKQTPRAFKNENIGGYLCKVPLQDNSSDCGLYLLQYVESFLQNPVVHFELPLRLDHWFPRNQVRRKREELRELVLQLYRRQEGGA
ncbi:sentrin-specific protease 7b [Triplophysa dalaica]|uniref:sentrin-specific protease 7b n=1 Tax=Triplophysa dalaica TaxID=1582913 RepID=UPI0024DFBA30|nr:sentrin-specific protease 7b [Triplophysa dalaica]